ncbi:band 4.1-like protein 4B [Lissotriton helveticus]
MVHHKSLSCHKLELFVILKDEKLDLAFLTETWLHAESGLDLVQALPLRYYIQRKDREIHLVAKGEEKMVSEKSLHSPLSPSLVPDHLKCNILKAQIDAVFRVGAQVPKEEKPLVNLNKTSSLPDTNVRSPAPSRTETTQSAGAADKQEIKPSRMRKLTRQYSFNHSDEDDLPPALAAVAAEAAAEAAAAAAAAAAAEAEAASPRSQRNDVPHSTDRQNQPSPSEKSPTSVSSSYSLEPGDLLMDFTEATPMIKTFPIDAVNPYYDPFPSVPQFSSELIENTLQCYAMQHSPKRLSPVPMTARRPSMEMASVLQLSHSSHKPISLVDR